LDYLSIGPNSVSFILAICTVKDWDQTMGIIGVSLSVGIQRQVVHGTFEIIAIDL